MTTNTRKAFCAKELSVPEADELYFAILRHAVLGNPAIPEGETLLSLIRQRDIKGLVETSRRFSGTVYPTSVEHFAANQFASLVRKYPFSVDLFDRKGAARKKFMAVEHLCRRQNAKFRAWETRKGKPRPYNVELEKMRRWVRYVLGPAPSLLSLYDSCGFGPGAALGVHGNATNFGRKLFARRWTVTPLARPYVYGAVMSNAHFFGVLYPKGNGFSSGSFLRDKELVTAKLDVVQNSKIVFVPKTVDIDRTINVEPLLNSYLQLGVGELMRERLLRVGVDIRDQSKNQRLAMLGSADEHDGFVTIDLSSASDSVSIGLVRALLPEDWFASLNDLRSPSFELDGEIYSFSKFCSMGNGFCFPLETLIFAAVVQATSSPSPSNYAVYGDDIVVRKSAAEGVLALLHWLGFRVNSGKTFLQGPFRESCGADFWLGQDVRPFTLDFRLDTIQGLFKFLNLSRRNDRTSMFFDSVRDHVLKRIPNQFRFFRPFTGPADTGIDAVGDEHLSCPHVSWSFRQFAWRVKELVSRPRSDRTLFVEAGETASALLAFAALAGATSSNPFPVRRLTHTKVRDVTYSGATSTWLPPPGNFVRSWGLVRAD